MRTVQERSNRRKGRGVVLHIKEYIQTHEIKLEREADFDEAVWCNIITGNSIYTKRIKKI